MTQPWQEFLVNSQVKESLRRKLEAQQDIFTFSDEPLLASLTTCLGLQSEVGNKKLDRLSASLNIDLESYSSNPWRTQIIALDNKIGIRMWIEDVKEFYPDHPDFAAILHPLSINAEGKLNQIIIFPQEVSMNYRKKHLDLAIVRDWALTSFLVSKEEQVNYFQTNEWEIKNNCARLQTLMMREKKVAFIGTHDLVDHLLGGDGELLAKSHKTFEKTYEYYKNVFRVNKVPQNNELITSYLIGVILDDMAQPKWYNSEPHKFLLLQSLELLKSLHLNKEDTPSLVLQNSFHQLIKKLRESVTNKQKNLESYFHIFKAELLLFN